MIRTDFFKTRFGSLQPAPQANCPGGAMFFRGEPVDLVDLRFKTNPDSSFPAIPPSLVRQMEEAAVELYGPDQGIEISRKVLDVVRQVRNVRSPALIREDMERPADWYKREVVYMLYPDRFGTNANGKPTTFRDLIPRLDYLKELGVTTLYVLPFLASPMIDQGFDVSDFKKVREELGGNEQFEEFVHAAREKGFKLKADMILNHVSDQHQWFQQALQGDVEKQGYFIMRDLAPPHWVKNTLRGPVAYYPEGFRDENGKIKYTARRLIFPDIADKHLREAYVTDETGQQKLKYFYHTFYPHQVDLNWGNPKLMLEMVDTLGYWANKGIDIFRFDAIPFLVKAAGTSGENLPQTHAVIKLLSGALQAMAPRTVIQAEACQWPKDILPYYGKEKSHSVPYSQGGEFKRTDEVQIAYHFPLMPAIWSSVLDGSPEAFWKAHKKTPRIPDSAAWALFLRVHDELTLEMVDPQTRQRLYDTLVEKGAPFRKGLGVSGRLADFLDRDPWRIGLIKSILYSMPGIPILYYGDEIGARGNKVFMSQAAIDRKKATDNGSGVKVKDFIDTRDLVRAPIRAEEMEVAARDAASGNPQTLEGRIFQIEKALIRMRRESDVLSLGEVQPVTSTNRELLTFVRQHQGRRVLVVHNLSGEPVLSRLSMQEPIRVHGSMADFKDLYTHQLVTVKVGRNKKQISVGLQPYQSLFLEIP